MNREEARLALVVLASGLLPDIEGTRRLLERASVHAESETLRDYLVEEGARRLLEEMLS